MYIYIYISIYLLISIYIYIFDVYVIITGDLERICFTLIGH